MTVNDPSTWQNPLRAVAQHAFQATSPQEISLMPNQVIYIAPQHLQGNLWNSGWLMASLDMRHAGLVPVNYIKVIRPSNPGAVEPGNSNTNVDKHEAKPDNISVEEMEKLYQA